MTWDRILDTFCQCDECLARGDRRGAMRDESMNEPKIQPSSDAEWRAYYEKKCREQRRTIERLIRLLQGFGYDVTNVYRDDGDEDGGRTC